MTTQEGVLILCYVDDVYQYAERRLQLYYEVIMQRSSTICDVYLFFVDMQIWALLKRTQFRVSNTRVRPLDFSLLSLGNIFIFSLMQVTAVSGIFIFTISNWSEKFSATSALLLLWIPIAILLGIQQKMTLESVYYFDYFLYANIPAESP